MPVTAVKVLSPAEALPLLAAAGASLSASVGIGQGAIGLTLPQLQARLAGLLKLQAQLALKPPSIAASLATAAKVVAGLTASLQASPPVVSGTAQLAAVAEAVVLLKAEIEALLAQLAQLAPLLELSAELSAALSGGALVFYAYEGPLDDLGPAVDASVASGQTGGVPPGDPVRAVVAVAARADAGASASLSAVFAV
ncbi:MAG TPA: hypothetical protein VFS43_00670 [Polyangiaceae bacterium]|nr:hypothetical protein [Polyangiaceae bacterium]